MQRIVQIVLALTLILSAGAPAQAASPATIPLSEIQSEAALLMDADTGQILYAKNADARHYPASTTKVMTGLLVAEQCDPAETAVASASAIDPVPRYTSHIAIDYDEEIRVRDALYALMLPSANDAANVLAEHVAGSQEAFVEQMNRRAAELGATGTNFVNAHGLHDPNHYTTAYDLALITRAAYLDGGIMPYMSAARYTMPTTNKQSERRDLTNQQFMLVPGMWVYNADVVAGKVGYTDEARYTMTSIASRNGRNLICVVLRTGYEERFEDTERLFDYGFDQFAELPLTEDELVGDASDLSAGGGVTLLLHRSLDAGTVRIALDADEPAAVVRVDGAGAVPGLPDELHRLPLHRLADDFVPASASLQLDQKTGSGFSLPAFARSALKVVLIVLAVCAVLFLALVLRRRHVLKVRRRQRQARMERIQRARREPR